MKPTSLLALALVALLVGACQSPPPAPPKAADPAMLAAQALERGQYDKAASLYRQALQTRPEILALHYGLAVAASYLNLKDEAVREFKWVLEHGQAGTTEVDAARRWLIAAGVIPRPSQVAFQQDDRKPGMASLEGRAVFAETGKDPKPVRRLQLFLVGQPNSPTKEERYNLRTDEDGRFKFRSVVPGPYKLTNRVAGQPIWRLRVELRSSQEMVLDLNPANSVNARDDFPEQR
ncbi:MAG TPA: tetratricopeptide repeat protein [Methylomirabilota bacterium]|nr:tetratricopeptide repeat protein [Methylomirabilota bacterium]